MEVEEIVEIFNRGEITEIGRRLIENKERTLILLSETLKKFNNHSPLVCMNRITFGGSY